MAQNGLKNATWLPTCHSTNSTANEVLKTKEVGDGWMFYTYRQTAGRGQATNSWESGEDKNLTFSKVYKLPFLQPKNQFLLNMAVSLALVDFLYKMKINAKIKWPNDIYINEKKIAGILIENHVRGNSFRHSVIGVGLNVNQKVFSVSQATSMALITGEEYDLDELLQVLSNCMDKQVRRLQSVDATISTDYMAHLYRKEEQRLYKSVSNSNVFEGVLKRVDDSGKLVVETSSGLQVYDFKEIAFVF